MNHSQAHIIATLGPSSVALETIRTLIENGLDAVHIDFSHGTFEEHRCAILNARIASAEFGRSISIIGSLAGPSDEERTSNGFEGMSLLPITEKDRESIAFCIEQEIDYIAPAHVGIAADLDAIRVMLQEEGYSARIVARIEQKEALRNFATITNAADAIMVVRERLAREIPLEQLPFIQHNIIRAAKWTQKPVIVATELLHSMIEHQEPTRSEIADVAYAIVSGADAVLLGDETRIGNYPVEAIRVLERIVIEAEQHMQETEVHLL